MAENKTKQTDASVEHYLAGIESAARREDCKALVRLMGRATGEKPRMWGTSIVGFGVRSYRYESGREGEICRVGFSSRKGDISIYGVGSSPGVETLLGKLGKHKRGKSCLYVARLSDVEPKVLEQLLATAATNDEC